MTFGYETRSEGDDPSHIDLAPLTAAVEEIRSAAESGRTAIETRLTQLATRLDAIDVRTQRPNGNSNQNEDETKALERRAFTGFLRTGREGMAPDEVRMLRVGDDVKGGYLAPAEFVAEVLKGLVQISPMRQLANVRSIAASSLIRPIRTGRPTAKWVGEVETRTGTESTYGQSETPVHEASCYVDVSQQLLEDAAVNVEAEVASDLAEEFGRLESVAFVNGDGIKKPLGIMNVPGISYTPSGAASDFATTSTTVSPADALINLMYAMQPFYRNNGSWLMNGSTLAKVRKFKDAQGQFIWQPSIRDGEPETILGRPVVEAVDMPDVGADTFPIIFGDFTRAYQIVDRVNFALLRDPYSVATSGLVRFHARRRVGGGVLLTEAVRKLKIATS